MAMSTSQPRAMYFLALTEMCQRFAFWGIGNLLVLYLVQYHNFSETTADHLFGIFTGVAFVLPVIGGYIADRMNYRFPVIWGMLFTSIGSFLIATGSVSMLYIALLFVAVGGAIFTPSIYALLEACTTIITVCATRGSPFITPLSTWASFWQWSS